MQRVFLGLTWLARSCVEYVPAKHGTQSPARVAPRPVEYIPLPQLVQFSTYPSEFSDQLPAGHMVHCQKNVIFIKKRKKSCFGAYRARARRRVPPARAASAPARPVGSRDGPVRAREAGGHPLKFRKIAHSTRCTRPAGVVSADAPGSTCRARRGIPRGERASQAGLAHHRP